MMVPLPRGMDGFAVLAGVARLAGADATDVLGGLASLDSLTEQQRRRGLGGAAAGFAVGLIGAIAADRSHRGVGSTAEPA